MYFIYNYTYIFEIRMELQMSTLNKNSKDQQIIKDNNGKKSQSNDKENNALILFK